MIQRELQERNELLITTSRGSAVCKLFQWIKLYYAKQPSFVDDMVSDCKYGREKIVAVSLAWK